MSFQIGNLDIGVAFAGDVSNLQQATGAAGAAIDGFGTKATKSLKDVSAEAKAADDSMARLANGIKGAFVGGSIAVGLIKLKNTIIETSDALIQAQVQLDKWNNGFKFGAGSASGGARELAFVRDEASRLGLELSGAATQYMKMVAAARGSNMEGEKTRVLFTSIAEAATVMGMSGEQSERAMMAVVQMMSKGKVQAEELRGQLGEDLPGAFSIAARAMGVTEVELNKLMETGQVMSADFLPKFAAQLRNELGGSVEDATKSMQASLNRFETAWLSFKQNVAESGVSDAIGGQINILSDAFNGISERMEAARKAGGGFWSQTAAGAGGVAQFLNPINALSYSAISLQGQLEQAKTKLNELEKERPYSGNIFLGPAIEETKQLIAELERAKSARDQLARQPGTGASEVRYSAMADADAIKAQQAQGYAYQKLMGDMATPQEKLTEAIFKAKKELGELYSPEIEARLRQNFIKPVREAKEKLDDFTKSAMRGEKLFGDLAATGGGLAGDFAEKWDDLAAAATKYGKTTDELAAAQATLLKQQPFYKKGLQDEADALKEQAKATAEATKAYDTYFDAVQKNTATLLDNIQSESQSATAIGLTKIAVSELEAAKLQDMAASKERAALTWESIDLSGQMSENLRAEAKALRDLGAVKINRAVIETIHDDAKQAADAWKKASEDIEKSLTGALMRGFESGKGFAEVLRDTVVNMSKTLGLRPVVQAISSPVAGAITGALGLSGAANAETGGGSLLGTAGTLSSAYNAINGGITNSITAGFNNLASSRVGQSLGLSVEAAGPSLPGMTAPTQLTSFGQTASSWATTIGGTMAGIALGSMAKSLISGGYSAGKGMDTFQNIGVAVGSAIGGPLVGAIIGAGAGVFNRAFGRKLKDQGIQGEFGGEAGFTGENFQFYKGGWFRSDKTKTSPLDADMQSGLANQFKAIQLQTALMATALGDTGQSVADFTSSIKVSFNGLTEAQIGEKLTETFAGIANDLAQTVLGDSAFAKEGEVASQTLQRLSTSLTIVNATWDALGFTLEAVSLAGGGAASSFIDLMGGLENFTAATAGYYANFYTETERAQFATEQLSGELGKLGQTMPTTRDGFRALVQAAEAAGNDALLAGLLNLQDEFAALVPAADSAAKSIAQENAGLQKEWLQTIGDTASLRALELEGLDASNRALKQQIWAYQDQAAAADAQAAAAQRAAEAAATAAQRAAEEAQRAADTYANALRDAQDYIAGVAKTVGEWVDAQNANTTNPTNNLASARAAFAAQMAFARGGDRDAINGITGYADRLLQAGSERLGYIQQQQLLAQTKAQLIDLPKQLTPEQFIVDGLVPPISAVPVPIVAGLDGITSTLVLTHTGIVDALQSGFAGMDADNNGLLTITEFKTGMAGKATDSELAFWFAKLDVSGDGTISQLELLNDGIAGVATAVRTGFAGMDADNNGLLTITEFKTGMAGKASDAELAFWFAKLDVSGDGTISQLELLNDGIAGVATAVRTGFAGMDADNNGLLTITEFKTGMAGKASDAELAFWFAKLDVSGDGTISQLELLNDGIAGVATAVRTGFAGMDADNNGLLTITEFKTGMAGKASDAELAFWFAKLDTNGDGALSQLELVATGQTDIVAALRAGFAAMDADNNGLLTITEFKTGMAGKASDAELAFWFAKLDTNGDGALSQLELVATRQTDIVAALRAGFAAMDADNNGLLTIAEFKAGMAGKATNSELDYWFALLDANGDGQLSKLEAIKTNTSNASGSFDPNDPLRSVFQAIKDSTFTSAFYLQDASNKLNAIQHYSNATADRLYHVITGGNSFLVRSAGGSNNWYANGGAFVGGVQAFATGGAFTNGIFNRPTMAPMALFGEAGPEAIMPLTRGTDGRLGVTAQVQMPDWSQYGRSDNAALVAEIKRLNDRLARIEAATTAAAVHSADSADSLRNIKNNGLEVFNDPATPLVTEAAP
jgi:tape measure domain-containing protein